VVLGLARLLAALPLSVLHRLGALAGRAVYLISPRYRHYLSTNLRAAGFAEQALLGQAVAEAGKGLLELPAIWLRPHATVAGWVTLVSGWELVEAALERHRGIIFLTPHLGCFEITAQYYAYRAPDYAPISVLYRPPKKKAVEPLMLAGRARPNLRLASAASTRSQPVTCTTQPATVSCGRSQIAGNSSNPLPASAIACRSNAGSAKPAARRLVEK
jgi:Kdo2-lipid IVA lauroyltransferase/acyltransferase